MKKQYKNTYVSILLFSAIVLALHWVIDFQFSVFNYYSLASVYVFHVISAIAVAVIIQLVHANFKDYTGYAFMGTSLVKMLAAILFLLPGFLSDQKPTFINILNFFIPYFLFLIFEAVQVIKLINSEATSEHE